LNHSLGIAIESLVALLLMLTIGYCMLLNKRLQRLKADEHSLKATIAELITATEIAERAIGGLKITVHECDMGLGERLRKAERLAGEIDRAVVSGKDLVSRLSQIVSAGRRADEPLMGETRPDEIKFDSKAAGKSDPKGDPKSVSKSDPKNDTKTESRIDARAVAAAAEAFAERLRTKVHGLAA
jgi:Domain of unknown function (DUF6468)